MALGILCLMLGAMAGRDVSYFPFYMGCGFLCIGRSLWIYQARWKYFRKHKINIGRTTSVHRENLSED
jgi:hypothetical protein